MSKSSMVNSIKAYAGYFTVKDKLIASSSGGAATAISEEFIRRGGIVYGAAYDDDYYGASYKRVSSLNELDKLKGSKYVNVKKHIKESDMKSVYECVLDDINNGFNVLFIGLGCDVSILKACVEKKQVSTDGLYFVELLCDGVTNEIVHRQYVENIERIHNSKVIEFSVRNKRDGWTPLYIYSLFDNGEEHIVPFYATDYGYAFMNYKRKGCYRCAVKGELHKGDIVIGDYWGCIPGMREYNEYGVSIIYALTDRSKELFDYMKESDFRLMETDKSFALDHSPRFFDSHALNEEWDTFDDLIKRTGLRRTVRTFFKDIDLENIHNKQIVLWGTGNCYHQLAPYVYERINVWKTIDSNPRKWGVMTEYGYLCESPKVLEGKTDVFVIIMIYNAAFVCQIINNLLNMNILSFEHVENWIKVFEY